MRGWVALALQVLGAAAVVVAIWRGSAAALLAAAGALAALYGWTIRFRPGRFRRRGPPPLSLREIFELLRKAHGAVAGWVVGPVDGAIDVGGGPAVAPDFQRRGPAIVHLASVVGRLHAARDLEARTSRSATFRMGPGC